MDLHGKLAHIKIADPHVFHEPNLYTQVLLNKN